jgi:hypothetical protein
MSAAVSGDDAAAVSGGATVKKRREKKNRMSAIRVWSDSGDQGLELLVVEQASEEQQIARQTQRTHSRETTGAHRSGAEHRQ